MTVNWSLIGDLELPISEISHHSLSHSALEGYGFSNFPTEEGIREGWRELMLTGGPLHEHWLSTDEDIHSNYIMAPFFGSFIFISPAEKRSGHRTALEMHSMICDEPENLVHEALESIGGVRGPDVSSVGLKTPPKDISVVSDLGLRVGLSSWLFQLRRFRPVTGVACGVPKKMLKKLFPNVSRWIIETDGIPPVESDGGDALKIMLNSNDPSHINDTLYDFRILEEFSSELGIELRTLIPIHIDETNVNAENYWPNQGIFLECEVSPTDQMEARMILGDRENSLKLLIGNQDLAEHWMDISKTRFSYSKSQKISSGVLFPFTKDEVELIKVSKGPFAFDLLYHCFGQMYDYSFESRKTMATILTGIGGQEMIEKIWKQMGPIGREGIKEIFTEILTWRKNDQIINFWELLDSLEGGNTTKDLDFRRIVALDILSKSNKQGDMIGVVRYIPDIISTQKNYNKDWEILNHLGFTPKKVLLTVNSLQDKDVMIQNRLKLFLGLKGIPNSKWMISSTQNNDGYIPLNQSNLVRDYRWMQPILAQIENPKYMKVNWPDDAFLWMIDLSPHEYLTCFKNKQMKWYLKNSRQLHLIEPRPNTGWKKPRALRSNMGSAGGEWEIYKNWAQLIEQPSWGDRFAYYKGSLAWIVSFLSLFAMSYGVLITTPTVVNNLGGNYWQGVTLSAFSIILGLTVDVVRKGRSHDGYLDDTSEQIKSVMMYFVIFLIPLLSYQLARDLDLTVESLMEVNHLTLAMGNLGIHPIPDLITVLTMNPLVIIFLVPIFWQINRIMMETHSSGLEAKEKFYRIISTQGQARRMYSLSHEEAN